MRLAVTGALAVFCFLLPWAVRWGRRRRWGKPVTLSLDPDDADPSRVAACLVEIARHLDASPERLSLVVRTDGRQRAVPVLDVDPGDRRLVVRAEGRTPKRVDLRGRWIPDHAVPLPLTRGLRLYFEPVDANRFRVLPAPPFRVPLALHVACSLLATAGVIWVVPEALAVAVGLALGTCCVKTSRLK